MLRYSEGIVLAAMCDVKDRELAQLRCALANLTEVIAQLPSGAWRQAEHASGIHHAYAVATHLIN